MAIPELARSASKQVQKLISGWRTRHIIHIRNPKTKVSKGRKQRIRSK
jgi:hypothetical protein